MVKLQCNTASCRWGSRSRGGEERSRGEKERKAQKDGGRTRRNPTGNQRQGKQRRLQTDKNKAECSLHLWMIWHSASSSFAGTVPLWPSPDWISLNGLESLVVEHWSCKEKHCNLHDRCNKLGCLRRIYLTGYPLPHNSLAGVCMVDISW